MTLKQQYEEAMKIFEERFIKQGDYGDKPIPPALVLPFLTSRYIIAAEQRIEEIKDEIEVVKNLGVPIPNTSQISRLQEKLKVAQKNLSEIKL